MWSLDDILQLDEAGPASTTDMPGVPPDTSSLIEAPTGTQSRNDPAVGYDAEIAYGVALEEYQAWDLGPNVGFPNEHTAIESSLLDGVDMTGSLMSDTDLWADYDGRVADDNISGGCEDPYIPPDTGAPLLSDNPTPWACNTAVAGPSTFPGALEHAGGTAGVDHAPPVTDQSRRDHVSLAINPGLLYAEQGSITNEYAAILDDDGWDEEDVIESDYEEVAEDDKDDAPITHDADEPTTFGEDDEHFPATEDGAIITDDERRSVEFHPIAFPIEGRVTRSQAALSHNASSTRPNDKGKQRAQPEPCNKESTQSPTTSGKRKEPSDPRDDKQDVPPRRNYTGGNIGTGDWRCLEPKCTRKYRREADMKRHWQWECVVRNPKLLKVVLCEYCGKRYVRPDVLRVHLRTCKIKKAQEESQAGGLNDGGSGRRGPVCLPNRVVGTHRICIESFHPFHSSTCLDPTSYELDASLPGSRRCRNLFMANDLSCGVRPASSSKYREQGLRSIFERCGRADKNEDFVSRVGDGEDERWRYTRCRDHSTTKPYRKMLITTLREVCWREMTHGKQYLHKNEIYSREMSSSTGSSVVDPNTLKAGPVTTD
ncbi:hypothetical protein POSPLADRAFT_1047267 [Postia placenta MAD-698-R-SB12]|uniref:C2H2-type domain-containing protein n=1 Tax=Postia placenta MAD-698-R-SB12 TaxID=670580 RepID=A0A1X6MXI8_9APHY|nr:hypothetical protein POSPLADRAFT_1047267 [Postia placenta MAD-698-R-SB12]OSX60972.1 hypothetical protein POSPLADRAFT_1047267 [Postia placenta MAD-698-R-SB12]